MSLSRDRHERSARRTEDSLQFVTIVGKLGVAVVARMSRCDEVNSVADMREAARGFGRSRACWKKRWSVRKYGSLRGDEGKEGEGRECRLRRPQLLSWLSWVPNQDHSRVIFNIAEKLKEADSAHIVRNCRIQVVIAGKHNSQIAYSLGNARGRLAFLTAVSKLLDSHYFRVLVRETECRSTRTLKF